MRNVVINVHNGRQTIETHHVNTNNKQPTVIQAQGQMNYEFVDADRGVAPNHIVTKRIGKDLSITFNDSLDTMGVLIIENFYKYPESSLIGLSEGGHYYYFVPDSAGVADYVTQLDTDVASGHALGGESFENPWWVGESSTHSFDISGVTADISPWLLGLGVGAVGLGLYAGLSGDDDNGKDNKDSTQDMSNQDNNVISVDKSNMVANCTDKKDIVKIQLKDLLDSPDELATIDSFANEDKIQLPKELLTAVNDDLSNLNEYVKYDATTGQLSYDSDGSGAIEAVNFATLNNSVELNVDSSHFQII